MIIAHNVMMKKSVIFLIIVTVMKDTIIKLMNYIIINLFVNNVSISVLLVKIILHFVYHVDLVILYYHHA